ncbi:hypothetical protein G6514_003995 [Epicoccum nigrum]|nr:hypothetical protein G6514_003995 [Epicoccum nigrum]
MAAADKDVIEGDIGESSQFVQVFVGPEVDPASDKQIDPERRRYKFQLIKHHIWNRTYFQDSLSAKHYFTPIGENTWELTHPELVNISPEDFCFVAEYLSNGRFGYGEPEDQEQFAEFFAQCMSAWRTAEQLKADDLLNHIVEKIHAIHDMRHLWDLWNPVVFTCSIYRADLALDAHTELKALFSEFIAEYYHAYLADDHTSDVLLTSFRQLPKLEKDVLAKRVDLLERQL